VLKNSSLGVNINMRSTAEKASQRSSVCFVHLMVDVMVPAGSGALGADGAGSGPCCAMVWECGEPVPAR
jgi:hypothetical protein